MLSEHLLGERASYTAVRHSLWGMGRFMLRLVVITLYATTSLFVAASPVSAVSCRNGGSCKVGDTGPGGGIVFYDAGSLQWWGQYLEFKGGVQWQVPWSPSEMASVSVFPTQVAGVSVLRQRVLSKAIGMGKKNTAAIISAYGKAGAFAANVESVTVSPKTDWYLPSKDEADALYAYLKTGGRSSANAAAALIINRNLAKSALWTSSEASDSFAWYQMFVDGTQFTDANGVIPGLKGNKATTVTPKHVGSNFLPMRLIATPVRAFPVGSGTPATKVPGAYAIGSVGPGGGIVFYDAGKPQSWGRYLEVVPADCEGIQLAWKPSSANLPRLYADSKPGFTAAQKRVLAKAIGSGKANTELIVRKYKSGSNYAALYAQTLVCHEADDWFLPSKDELDLVFNNLKALDTPLGNFDKGYYWTSTEYNNETAWSQYFTDGQQFDRVKTLSANRTGAQRPFRVRAIRAFG